MSNGSDKQKHIEALLTQIENHEYLSQSHTPWIEGVNVTSIPITKSSDEGNEAAKEVNMFLIKMLLDKGEGNV